MLDTETKRRIDTARDILVGKVPDPKSQVEQITIALIYKFMDDMDAESEELGGKRKFFTGKFAQYGWPKLMHSGLGGHEVLALYADGISKMPENPGIPPLFRDIFKNAYLPYRDPETLKSFLKTIDGFTYDHSERLGDAFEYLLSVLGSQGDAGQFRTPRHIIDFIVSIVDPKKGEVILDPACGTAGFLISAYKHILKASKDEKKQLTPDERLRLAKNLKGYDISPDMVRLSLVNLYLHNLPSPNILEYDTLTSEERWNEYADIILANPPFMSPKGGIRPHKRFSIDAKRSEVLFVDYIAEHLTPTGRAGIIVPEGIIFQSGTAYKQLRKSLVETSLVAIISLPAGMFNPYSGVKTSILILDKSLAKQSDTIGFFKIENDGFGLGAQRRAIEKDDIPKVSTELKSYLASIRAEESPNADTKTTALIVPKSKIAANGDYNLSGERYRVSLLRNSAFPMVPLAELIEDLESGVSVNSINTPCAEGQIGVLKTSCVTSGVFEPEQNKTVVQEEMTRVRCPVRPNTIIISRMNTEALVGANAYVSDGYPHLFLPDRLWQTVIRRPDVNVKFLQHVIGSDTYRQIISDRCAGTSGSMKNISKPQFLLIEVPLLPLEDQNHIVAEIESYQKVINGARAVLDNYRPQIPINPDWPTVELREVIDGKPKNGYSGSPVDRQTNVKVLSLSATTSGMMDLSKFKYLDEVIPAEASCRCRRGDIYLQRGNTKELVGTAAILDTDAPDYIYPDLMIRVRANEQLINSRYLLTALQGQPIREFVISNAVGAAGSMPKINQSIVERIPIPLPPLTTQQAIVAEIEAEQALVAANRELIARFERKIQATLARIWGDGEAA